MTFTTQRLTGSRTVVKGTDSNSVTNSCVLYTRQWDEIKAHDAAHLAEDAFDQAIEKFYAPIVSAAEKLERAATVVADPITYIVMHEGEESVQGRPADVIQLDHASQVMRILEMNAGDERLIWVGDSLEILEDQSVAGEPEVDDLQAALDLVSSELGAVHVSAQPTDQGTVSDTVPGGGTNLVLGEN